MADPVTKSIIVKGPVDRIYQTWANFENFPQFMQHITRVTKTGEDTSHWEMEGPLGVTLKWDAKTTRMETNKRIAWNSTEGQIQTSGQVTFTPLPDEETQVTITLKYVPPAGIAGEAVAQLFGDPEGKLGHDLRAFKAYIESLPA